MGLLNDFSQYDDPYNQDPNGYDPGGGGTVPVTPTPTPITTGIGYNTLGTLPTDPKTGGGGKGTGTGFDGLNFNFDPVPKFTAPDFVRPDPNNLFSDPAYKFRLDQGQQGLQRSAAAKGLLRSGGTLKDLIEYNQNFASQEYSNEFNRAVQEYQLGYTGAKDEFAPLFAQWGKLTDAEIARVMAAYNRGTIWNNPNGGGGGGGSTSYDPEPIWQM